MNRRDKLLRLILGLSTILVAGMLGSMRVFAKSVTMDDGQDRQLSLKVIVAVDGIYQITYDDLVSAGWDVENLTPTNIKLYHLGVEIPVWIQGQDDGIFNLEDSIIFYGQAMIGRYTRQNVYWLSSGDEPGLRMDKQDVQPIQNYPIPESFPATLHAEEHPTWYGYWQNPPGREAQDHWYWTGPLNAPASVDLTFHLPPFDNSSGNFEVRVLLAGRTNDLVNPDHHTRVLLNGLQVDEAMWDGQIEFQHTTPISGTILNLGGNSLTVETSGNTGAMVDGLYVNWLEIDYQAAYIAQEDRLVFGAPDMGNFQFQIERFTTNDIEIFNISNPESPLRLTDADIQTEGNSFTAIFEDDADASARYLALATDRYRSPLAIKPDQDSDLRNLPNGADEIIITYDDFYTDTLPLAAHRESQGLRVQVVRISDVYDEFSGGIFTPQAIRDFLTYAYHNWPPPAPSYVLLVGDAHLDYLDNFGTAIPNFVPTYIFDADEVGETANDNWFARVDGDDPLPDLAIGRFPARNREDVQAMAAKTIAYESTPPSSEWVGRALFVADDDLETFENLSDSWRDLLPDDYEVQKIYASAYPPGNAHDDIVSAINQGVSLVSYIGHGNQDRWGTWSGGVLLNSTDVRQLTNGQQLPFVATATCLNGFFPNPLLNYAIAEEWIRNADGGAIGVWSPSALGSPSEHAVLFEKMFENLFAMEKPRLGDMTMQAKVMSSNQGVSQELIETFTLFGDPGTRFKLKPVDPYKIFLPLIVSR